MFKHSKVALPSFLKINSTADVDVTIDEVANGINAWGRWNPIHNFEPSFRSSLAFLCCQGSKTNSLFTSVNYSDAMQHLLIITFFSVELNVEVSRVEIK